MMRRGSLLTSALCWVFATGCSNEEMGASEDGGEAGAESGESEGFDPAQDCVDRINALRATLSLPPYARWMEAEDCADMQAEADSIAIVENPLDNQPNFGMCGESDQNTCPGWADYDEVIVDCFQQMWDEGPGEDIIRHGRFLAMSSTEYTKVACGFHEMPGGQIWANVNFQ